MKGACPRPFAPGSGFSLQVLAAMAAPGFPLQSLAMKGACPRPFAPGSGFSLQVLAARAAPGFPLQSLTPRLDSSPRCRLDSFPSPRRWWNW